MRQRSSAVVAKMRRIQQSRKGKEKVSFDQDEDDESDEDDDDDDEAPDFEERNAQWMHTDEETTHLNISGACGRLSFYDQNAAMPSGNGGQDENLDALDEDGVSVALVTFVEKPEAADEDEPRDPHGETSSGGLCATNVCQPENKVQFYAEDGRVDVGEVLDHLNATNLEYEWKPGIWRNLRSLKSGKSAKKFRHMQTVHVRKTSLKDFWPWKSQHRSRLWVDTWLVEGDSRKAYCSRVSRLCFDDRAGVVGTAVKFENPYGLLLTTHHCCTWADPASGKTLIRDNLSAFNTRVDIVHLSSNYDLAFLLLRSGPYVGGFRLATSSEEQRGRPVRMISFPWHVDNAYGFDHESVAPTEVHGHIANLGPKEQKLPLFVDALATYMGGFAASPGGAVTLNSKVLAGVHVRAIWHQKGETILPFKGKSKLSTYTRRAGIQQREIFGETSNRCRGNKICLKRKRRASSRSSPDAQEVAKKMKLKEKVDTDSEQEQEQGQAQGRDGDPGCSSSTCSRASRDANDNRPKGKAVPKCVLLVNRNSDAKCSMYHGYLSTYLSARHIAEEYHNFIAAWTAMEGELGRNCLPTRSGKGRSQSRRGSSRSRNQSRKAWTPIGQSTKPSRRIPLKKRRRRKGRRAPAR